MRQRAKLLALLIIPLAFLLYVQGNFAYPVRGDFSDLTISHLPNAEFLRASLLRGEIPLWSPLLFAGYPFAANPLSGLQYPLGWPALFFPLPFGFNLVTALHLCLAGLGMYLFLRRDGLSDWPALAAGVAFQAMPKLMAHYAAGHLTLTYAVCLTPWLLWAEQKRLAGRRFEGWRVAPGILLALIALADPRWAPYAAVLWLAYAAREFLRLRREGHAPRGIAWLGGVAAQGGVVAALSAALWAPLLQLIPLTTRSVMTASERIGISLPPANLLGVFIPSMGSYAEWELYAGALPWLLCIFTLAVPQLRRQGYFWLGLLAAGLLVSLGDALPGYRLVSGLPGFSMLRVPARSLFLCGFAFAVLTGRALEFLRQNRVEQKPEPVFFMVPFVAFPLLIAAGMAFFLGGYFLPFLWAGVALAIGMVAILAAEKGWIPAWAGQGLFLLLLVIEMAGMDASSMTLKPRAEVLQRDAGLLETVSPEAGELYRVYSPSFSLPQYVAVQKELALVDGIDPLQLNAYVELFSAASGIPRDGYSVTLPPFPQGKPREDNAGYSPDTNLLGILNTKYVVSAFPIQSAGLRRVENVEEVYLYENLDYRERAWVEGENGMQGGVQILDYRANRVILEAAGPGRLVLADADYPGWQATVDGADAPIEPYLGALRSVRLGAGDHRVVFSFRPLPVYAGWAVSLGSWVLILILSLKHRRRDGETRA